MITINVSSKKFFEVEAEGYVYILEEGFTFSKQLQELAQCFFPNLQKLMQKCNFNGKKLDTLILPIYLNNKIAHSFFI